MDEGTPNWFEVNKLREDLRASERKCEIMRQQMEFTRQVCMDYRDKLNRAERDMELVDWLCLGDTAKKLERVLAVWNDGDNNLPPDFRAVLTYVAKEGVK